MDTKKIRTQALLTQSEFAKEIGVSLSCVSKWERGEFKPSFAQQRKILEFVKKNGLREG